jgi:hypothetical protein
LTDVPTAGITKVALQFINVKNVADFGVLKDIHSLQMMVVVQPQINALIAKNTNRLACSVIHSEQQDTSKTIKTNRSMPKIL